MVSEVVMPQMGADMVEGTILRWLKHEGDPVERGEPIAEIETDKANVEIEAFDSGVFRKVLHAEGDTVPVGEIIAVIAAPDEDISKYTGGTDGARSATQPAAPAGTAPQRSAGRPDGPPADGEAATTSSASGRAPEPPPPPDVRPPQPAATRASAPAGGRLRVSPVARRIAEERGIDLRTLRGTGPDGRIIKRDVEAAAAALAQARPAVAPAAAPPPPAAITSFEGMSRMRQAIARRMSQAKRESPHYYLLVDIDMTEALAFRKQANAALPEDARISINDIIVKACAVALQRHPQFNVTVQGDEIRRHDVQNICIAVALDDGLIAPALLDVGRKPLSEIARESKDLASRARGGSMRPEELTEGTFTITNLGAFGVETLIGIIQPPQTAILGVGTALEQPVVRDGQIVVRQVMKVALSADHRITDGAEGARFLSEIKRLLETPALMVV